MIWIFAVLLVVWGNLVNYFVQPMLPGGDWAAVTWGVALAAISLAAARAIRADAALRLGNGRVAALAALIGILAAGLGTAVLRLGPIVGPVVYRPLFTATDQELAVHIAFFLPLAAVIPEEIAFRGALVGGLLATGIRRAVVVSAVVFALWHAWVLYVTLAQTSLADSPLAWLAASAAFAFLVAGGVALATLRLASRGLLAPIAAHWAFDAALLLGLRA